MEKRKINSKKFGRAMVSARLSMGAGQGKEVTQSVAASALGVSSSFLCRLEQGKTTPNVALLSKITAFYGEDDSWAILGALGLLNGDEK